MNKDTSTQKPEEKPLAEHKERPVIWRDDARNPLPQDFWRREVIDERSNDEPRKR